MITIFGNSTTVTLPLLLTWAYSNPRQTATKVSLAGNEIHQYAERSTSAGTFSYSGDVASEAADSLDVISYATGEVTVSDGKSAWQATIDVQIRHTQIASKKNVTLTLKCVRKVV